MGQLESTLKSEIQRLTKREVRTVSVPLKREVRGMRVTLSKLSKTLSTLERFAKEMAKQAKPKLEASPEEVKISRLTGPRIRSLRTRLGLSQRELGILTGASVVTVGMWEQGKFRPQGQKKAALVAMRKLGKRQVKNLLADKEAMKVESKQKRPQVKTTQKKEPRQKRIRRRK